MLLEGSASLTSAGLACLTAGATTWLATPVVRALAVRYGQIAKPVEDRWGKRIIARLGGAAMYVGFIAAILCWVPLGFARSVLLGATLVFGLGLVDDLHRLPPYTKLVAQLLIGSVVVASGLRLSLASDWLAIPLSVLWFVLIMNAFNLLDNMDGLAAGTGAIASAACALHGGLEGQGAFMTVALALMGACLGFLRYNFPPAKVFMGDSGSHLIGFVLAALALMGSWRHSTQLLTLLAVPTLVLAVPIFDTCFVTMQRVLHRLHPFVGGTDHVSHRLAILGLSERQTVTTLYAISAALGLLSVITADLKPLSTLALWVVVLTGLVLFGAYLARVKVYQLTAPETGAPPAAAPTTTIQTMLLHKRRVMEVLVDFCLISSVYIFAYLLRFEGTMTPQLQGLIVKSLPVILIIKLGCFGAYGLYRGVWRYVGLADLLTTSKAVAVSSVISAVTVLYVWRFEGFSRAVFIIDWALTFLAIGGARVMERLLDEWILRMGGRGKPVLIVGAGDMGARVLRLLSDRVEDAVRVVGFLDDDVRKHGSRIQGVPVLGGRSQLAEAVRASGAQEVWVAIADPSGELLQAVQRCCEPQRIAWRLVTPNLTVAA